jgi:hypothetical protein
VIALLGDVIRFKRRDILMLLVMMKTEKAQGKVSRVDTAESKKAETGRFFTDQVTTNDD